MNESYNNELELRLIEAARKQSGRSSSAGIGFDETLLTQSRTPQALGVVRDYTLVEKLGEGGMGAVYRAIHQPLQKTVAVKVLSRGKLAGDNEVGRFQREMRALGRLEHPNIVNALDAGEDDGLHYLVMQFVEGWDLQRVAERVSHFDEKLALADACEITRQAAKGLQHAHQSGLIHRDIKPSNLMLTRDGQTKILDLGLALALDDVVDTSLTGTGHAMGTLDYMAPEQAVSSHDVDVRADIYSLGATLYFLASGQPPLPEMRQARRPADRFALIQNQVPRPLSEIRSDVGRDLNEILSRMLAKDPADRFATPADVALAIEPLCDGADPTALAERLSLADKRDLATTYSTLAPVGPVANKDKALRPPIAPAKPGRTSGRRWWIVGGAFIALTVSAGFLLPALFPGHDNPPQIELKASHYRERGDENALDLFGVVGEETFEALYNDLVRLTVELDRPSYCYLFACNPASTPDIRVQRCFPADDAPPKPTDRIEYPSEAYFRLNDGIGQQAFFVVVSQDPLPSFSEWLESTGLTWDVNSQTGVWKFDGQRVKQLFPDRGQEVAITSAAFDQLAKRITKSHPEVHVRGLAFPIAKDGSNP